MSYDWGPHYLVPSEVIESYSGAVQLREELDDELLAKELAELGLTGPVAKIANPWYYRPKGEDTWRMVGESTDRARNFPVRWDTSSLPDGRYEIMGLMHVYVKQGDGEHAIARQNIVEVTVKN